MGRNQKKRVEKEQEFFMSDTNIRTLNYKVYYLNTKEKFLYGLFAFAIGAAVGYLFYGGIGKDEFNEPTIVTYVLNILIPTMVGIIAAVVYLPIRTEQILDKRKKALNSQFKDMLDALSTSLGAGKNVSDSFLAIKDDLKIQYESDAYIINELEVILSGVENNIAIEDMLYDFGQRSGNDDIQSFANVFKICYRKGGNIKDIIKNTNTILNDKMDIIEDIETIVTANKTEQNIMVLMPIALIGIIKLMSPEFARNFATPSGIFATTIAVIAFVIAYFVGKQVLNIKI